MPASVDADAPSAPAYADDAEFKAKVQAFIQTYEEAWNAKNVEGVMATYAPDGLEIRPDGQVLRGAQTRKRLEEAFAKGVHQQTRLAEVHRIGDAGFAFGSATHSIPGTHWQIEATWSATFVIEKDKVLTKLLMASYPPPPAK